MEKDKITGNSTKVRFNIPEAAKTADGVYVSMKINAMNGNSMDAYLKINYADIGKNSSEGTKENTVSISQFGGYDIKTVVTYKDNKVTDLEVTGENFAGSFAVPNQRDYLPKAINKIKEQVIGLNIKDQTAFDKIDTVSGATTSATAIKNAVIESLGLKVKEEILAPAPTTIAAGTYQIQMKNMTDTVEHSISASDSENKVTATLKVDANGKITISYPVITKEAMDVLAFNGYYKGTTLTKKGSEETKNDENIVTNVTMPLTSNKPEQTYKANFKMYVPAMSGLNGTRGGITFDHGTFDTDATITLYWDTLKEIKTSAATTTPATITSTKPSASASTTKITAPSKVQKVKVKNIKKKSAKITFKKVKGANGYIIYRASKNMENIKQLQH